jgi:sensor histidine kinase YesM
LQAVKVSWMHRIRIFGSIFLILYWMILPAQQALEVFDLNQDYFIGRKYARHFVDTSSSKTCGELIRQDSLFQSFRSSDLYNRPVKAAHWLRFQVVSKVSGNFTLELYDFNIEEVQVHQVYKNTLLHSQQTGYSQPFHQRSFLHKNLNLDLPLIAGDTVTVYMRFKSNRLNVLEPVLRSTHRMMEYGLSEYMMLGIFYGLALLILLFNFTYLIILRDLEYLYYSFFMLGILLYLMSQNGTGFQYIWPHYPEWNPYMDKIGLSFGMFFMLLFSYHYLRLASKNVRLSIIYRWAMVVLAIVAFIQFIIPAVIGYKIIYFLFIQLAFVSGIIQYRRGEASVRYYVCAFTILNLSFLCSMAEYLGYLPSSSITVYALNIGIVLQFIFLSIGMAEAVRVSYQVKNRALSEVIEAMRKTETMRLVELKRQMNPHFIFNALNSVLHRIRVDNKDDAAQFLVLFSRLIRRVLDSSDKIFLPLEEELEVIRLYIEIESMRLGNSFEYHVQVAPGLDTASIRIPTFILQPLVENAIWHGLIPKEGERRLEVSVRAEMRHLYILITDNGVGRQHAAELKSSGLQQSKGIELIRERLNLIQLQYKQFTSIEFLDLKDSEGRPIGTQVALEIEF